jgi:hypothetical protein
VSIKRDDRSPAKRVIPKEDISAKIPEKGVPDEALTS